MALGLGGTGMVASKWAKPVVDSVVVPLHAQGSALVVTIASNTAGTVFTGNNNVGQSVTMPGSGSFNNLRFNWYGSLGAGPIAAGTLYLLTQEYLGLPGGLGPATPGFVASAPASGSQYVFPPGTTVIGGTEYWFYCDAMLASFLVSLVTVFPGGSLYIGSPTGVPPLPFSIRPGDANFLLQGVVVP
jgi:hypothetical protein